MFCMIVWYFFLPTNLFGQTPEGDIFSDFPFSPNASGIGKNDLYLISPSPHTDYSFDEAIKVEAASLARGTTDLLYARDLVQRAKDGATVYVWLDKAKVMVDIENVDETLKEFDKRLEQYQKAADKRGRGKVSHAYDMLINFEVVPTLIDNRSGSYWWWDGFSYQPIAIVENKFAIKDYENTEVTLIGNITSEDSISVEIWIAKPNLLDFSKIPLGKRTNKITWRARSGKQMRYASAYSSRANFNLGSGKLEWALEDANSALEIDPKDQVAYLVRSQVYSSCSIDSVRDGTKALADADEYCKLSTDPKNKWKCAVVRGGALAELGRFDEAIAETEAALEHAPEEGKAILLSRLEKYKKKTPHRASE